MKSIILAAGYATRLYPLTENTPKHLLEVAGKPILDHIIEKIEEIDEIDEIFVITNDKFYNQFIEWESRLNSIKRITVVNDGTRSNEDRLGSLGDIRFVIEKFKINEDFMVVLGDNIFEFSLLEQVEKYKEKQKTVVVLYDVKDIEVAKRFGVVLVDEDGTMIDFEEKPAEPKSTLISTGIYIYPQAVIDHLFEFLSKNNPDRAGDFLHYLHKKESIHGESTDKLWFDIGSLDHLEEAQKIFGDLKKV